MFPPLASMRGARLLPLIGLAASGCGTLFGPDLSSDLDIHIEATPAAAAEVRLLTELSLDGWTRRVPGEGTTRIAAPGQLAVRVLLFADGDTVAFVELDQRVEEGYDYGLALYLDRGDPRTLLWVACVPRVYSAPLRTRPSGVTGDSVFVTWIGLTKGAIC